MIPPSIERDDLHPAGAADMPELRRIVARLHDLHALSAARVDLLGTGWTMHVVSAATGVATMFPSDALPKTTPNGLRRKPDPRNIGRDLVAECAQAFDEVANEPPDAAPPRLDMTRLDVAALRAACPHERFADLIRTPKPACGVTYREGAWRRFDRQIDGRLEQGATTCGYARFGPWRILARGAGWRSEQDRIYVQEASVPAAIAAAAAGRPLDDVIDIAPLRGAGLIVRRLLDQRPNGRNRLRIDVERERIATYARADEISLAMDAAKKATTGLA